MDLSILKAFDFERFRPKVFCVETLTYTEDGGEEIICELQSILQQNDYLIYADTYVNTIAVARHAWTHRKLLRACKRVSTKA